MDEIGKISVADSGSGKHNQGEHSARKDTAASTQDFPLKTSKNDKPQHYVDLINKITVINNYLNQQACSLKLKLEEQNDSITVLVIDNMNNLIVKKLTLSQIEEMAQNLPHDSLHFLDRDA